MKKYDSIRDIMTTGIQSVQSEASVFEAARIMGESDVGALIVDGPDGRLYGIITDRDITVRCTAEALDAETTPVEAICTTSPVSLSTSDTIEQAVQAMVDASVRRLPVVDGSDDPVGIVSLGDLAVARQPDSALGAISAAPAQA